MTNTQDISKLGYREIDQLADLLKAYADNPNDSGLGDDVKWEYNPNSDNLFLVDSDCNVAMMTDGKLEEFHTCSYCGHEGFAEDFREREEDGDKFLACPDCEEAGRNPEEYLIPIN